MYNNISSGSTENETGSWSFSFDYQRFSNKNKPKSRLGRRTVAQVLPGENENIADVKASTSDQSLKAERTPMKFQNQNEPSLTHPVNPKIVTPIHKFSHPTFDSQIVYSSREKMNESKGKSCQRGLGFSTPFRIKESHPLKDISASYDQNKLDDTKTTSGLNGMKEVSRETSSVFVASSFVHKDLNKSFIYEDTYPLPDDNFHSNETNNQINVCVGAKISELSQSGNINNSCSMTAHEIHHSDLSSYKCNPGSFKTPGKHQESICSKTPGRNFTLFRISQSPIDPLAGILNEDNESFNSDNSVNNTSLNNIDQSDNKVTSLDLKKQTPIKTSPQANSNEDLEVDEKNGAKMLISSTNDSSLRENEFRTTSGDAFATQTEVTQINAISQQNGPSSNIIEQTHISLQNKLQSPEHPKKNGESISNVEPNKVLNTPVSNTIDAPTVIATNQRNIISQACPVKTGHPLHVPANNFINSRLILKPEHQNLLYVNGKPYTALSLLGRGGSSEVYQVIEENSSRLMAIKCVNLANVEDSTAKGYLNEIELLSKLQGCASVIKMFDHEYVKSTKMLYVVMEKGEIDLSKLMKDITKIKKIPMSMIIYYWTEMLSAVKDIHDKGVIHSDLKPGNFLLVTGRLKLIDFGIASSLQGDMTSVEKDVIRGTFNYISPETISAGENRFHKISYKSDVWSLGCILYNLLFGCTPFSHITSTLGKLQAIADPNYKIKYPKENTHIPPALRLSLGWCLIKNAKSRPTVDRLLKLAEHAIGVPQTDNLWNQYVIKEFPDCCIRLQDLGE